MMMIRALLQNDYSNVKFDRCLASAGNSFRCHCAGSEPHEIIDVGQAHKFTPVKPHPTTAVCLWITGRQHYLGLDPELAGMTMERCFEENAAIGDR